MKSKGKDIVPREKVLKSRWKKEINQKSNVMVKSEREVVGMNEDV